MVMAPHEVGLTWYHACRSYTSAPRIVFALVTLFIIPIPVDGAKKTLLESGVTEENITVETVPGSYELPLSVSKIYAASQLQAGWTRNHIDATDSTTSTSTSTNTPRSTSQSQSTSRPFDAILAIGVVVKGTSMHFEYLSDAVTHGLMRAQLDLGVPVIFGLLTVLTVEQGLERAGLGTNATGNHGEDWGRTAVELGVKRQDWANGKIACRGKL